MLQNDIEQIEEEEQSFESPMPAKREVLESGDKYRGYRRNT